MRLGLILDLELWSVWRVPLAVCVPSEECLQQVTSVRLGRILGLGLRSVWRVPLAVCVPSEE